MAAIRKDQLENASKFMSAFWEEMVKPFSDAAFSRAAYQNPRETGGVKITALLFVKIHPASRTILPIGSFCLTFWLKTSPLLL